MNITYNTNPVQLEYGAVLLQSNLANDCLSLINDINEDFGQLEIYAVPSSIEDLKPIGFIIKLNSSRNKPLDRLDVIYLKSIGQKLFIPFDAALMPQIDASELDALLLFPLQVFLKDAFIGFEIKDRWSISDLLAPISISGSEWKFAQQGYARAPELNSIKIIEPPIEDVLKDVNDSVEKKDLKDILTDEEKKSKDATPLDGIKKRLLKWGLKGMDGGAEMLDKLMEQFPAGNFTEADIKRMADSVEFGNSSFNPGLISKLRSWMEKNLEDLENKRNKELDKLLDLFDKDPEEALKYALPLNSNYQARGQAPPSSNLGRRNTNFNLRNLGGGMAVDGWNVDNHYNDLRKKYLEAALKAIRDEDYKRAAYIYAELLGDFFQAASVLRKGKYFAEAAAIYKEHLNNNRTAADCYLEGGMYLEAIEEFKGLSLFEKVGDIYNDIDQPKMAKKFYKRVRDEHLDKNNFLDAARLSETKLKDNEEAMEILFEGWEKGKSAQSCLKHYFVLSQKDNADQLPDQIYNIYENTPIQKKRIYLEVLIGLFKNSKDVSLKNASQNVSYRIIDQLAKGNKNKYNDLREFNLNDRLLSGDISRTLAYKKVKPKQLQHESIIRLDPSYLWFDVKYHMGQLLALGRKDLQLVLARVNWYGNKEMYEFSPLLNSIQKLELIADSHYSNEVFMYTGNDYFFDTLKLPRNKYFDTPLSIKKHSGMNRQAYGFAITGNGMLTVLDNKDNELLVYEMDNNVEIQSTTDVNIVIPHLGDPQKVIYRGNYLFTKMHKYILYFARGKNFALVKLANFINDFDVSYIGQFHLLISTKVKCTLHELSDIDGKFRESDTFDLNIEEARKVKFLDLNYAVAISEFDIYLINLKNKKAKKVGSLTERIVDIVPCSNRHYFGVMTKKGLFKTFEKKMS